MSCVGSPAKTVVCLLTGAAVVAGSAVAMGAATPSATGSPYSTSTVSSRAGHGHGIGDPYYPADGNRGYDGKRYFVKL
ncbi:MAG: hypothetical protein ACR2GB_00555 [Nocardioidaceae bacterium]